MNTDDPQLTAYALGELRGRERDSLREKTTSDTALREEVAAIARLADQLGDELRSESARLRLDSERRLALLTRPKPQPAFPLPAFIPVFGGAIAASLVLALWITTRTPEGQALSRLEQAPEAATGELVSPQMTISFIPYGQALSSSDDGLHPDRDLTRPPLPSTSLIPRSTTRPTPTAGPRVTAPTADNNADRHPSSVANLANRYAHFTETPANQSPEQRHLPSGGGEFIAVSDAPVMGLSMNAVEGALSLQRLREDLRGGQLPQPGSIRLEELVNHFDYRHPARGPGDAFAVAIEVGTCPWAEDHLIAKIDAAAREQGNRAPGAVAQTAGLQVTFNPALVSSYRLLGFHQKGTRDPDAFLASGQVQPGRRLTALYEIVPVEPDGIATQLPEGMHLADHAEGNRGDSPIVLDADILYQLPGKRSRERLGQTSAGSIRTIDDCSDDFRFAVAAAAFVLHIENDPVAGQFNLHEIVKLAKSGAGNQPSPQRQDFIRIVEDAVGITPP